MSIDLEKLEDSSHLLELLVQMEDILDSLDLYVYKNWFDGEVVEGPIVRRHWVSMSILYTQDKMPNPTAAFRLLKHNIKVEFSKVHQQGKSYKTLQSEKEIGEQAESSDTENESEWFWMVKLTFPRRLLDDMNADLDYYDDEVDAENVEDAKDSGIDAESGYSTDDQEPQDGAVEDPFAQPPGPGDFQ